MFKNKNEVKLFKLAIGYLLETSRPKSAYYTSLH